MKSFAFSFTIAMTALTGIVGADRLLGSGSRGGSKYSFSGSKNKCDVIFPSLSTVFGDDWRDICSISGLAEALSVAQYSPSAMVSEMTASSVNEDDLYALANGCQCNNVFERDCLDGDIINTCKKVFALGLMTIGGADTLGYNCTLGLDMHEMMHADRRRLDDVAEECKDYDYETLFNGILNLVDNDMDQCALMCVLPYTYLPESGGLLGGLTSEIALF